MSAASLPKGEESRFQGYADLAKWGWTVKEMEVEGKGKGGRNWEGVLEMLGVPFGDGDGGWKSI